MAHEVTLIPSKTYATHANVRKAVEEFYKDAVPRLHYIVVNNTAGRFYPIFIGSDAIQMGVHHRGFCVVA